MKMQCTSKEIEEKRRLAQEKLSKKNLISGINKTNSNLANNENSFSNRNVGTVSPANGYKYSFSSNGSYSPKNLFRTNAPKPYDKPKPILQFNGKTTTVTGTCALIAEDRFVVELSGFSSVAIDVFKTIPSRSYNYKTRLWDFSMSDYKLFQTKIASLQPTVVIGKLPQFVLKCCSMDKPNYFNIDLGAIDRDLLNTLMPFQEEGVCFAIDKGGRCLIADEMGLGKTFQALAVTSYYREDFPVLIVTTSSMKNNWEETIHKYMPSISIMHTQYMVSGKDYIGDSKILIVSHDMMSRCADKLLERRFRTLIIDESHNLKNFKAKCTKAATELAKHAVRVILLSGTPALSRPSELYTQLALIDETFFGNFFEFSKRYCDGKTTQFGWDSSGKSNLQELEIILAKRFMIRRTKEEVLKSLPNKVQEVVRLDVNLSQFSEEERKNLNSIATNYVRQKGGTEKHAALLTFFAESAKIKIPSVCSYVLQTLEETKKFIVFAHHKIMLDAIGKILSSKNVKFIRIDGNTTSEQRKIYIDKFQLDNNYVCAVLSITAANAGITLTSANLVIFAELHWNPSILSQAESRAHRIGQEAKVLVKYLVASDTADDSMWTLLQDKQKILCEVGLFQESFNNVSVTKQNSVGKILVPEIQGSDRTSLHTLDITAYFTKPDTKGIEQEFLNCEFDNELLSEICNKVDSRSPFNKSSAEEDFFNDELDDVLGNVVLNV